MLIQILGAGFDNKGAQLMLETVISRLSLAIPEAEFCIEQGRRVPVSETDRLRMKRILCRAPGRVPRLFPLLLRASDLAGRVVPQSFCQERGFVARHNIDALIDIAGFCYGDACGPKLTRLASIRAEYFAGQHKPVILLPQMFGTFQGAEIRPEMRRLCAAAELILARDSISYRCVEELISAPSDKLALAPDVTIFSEPDPTTPIPENPYACVVPNVRVLRDGEAGWRDLYLPRLLETIRFLREHDLDVVLMEHETLGGDRRIIDELLAGLSDDNVRICNYPSPFRLKAILGGARLVVASRYHAVVGALSSGVPTAVIGWAHKYEMLLTDFGVPDCIHGASGGGSHLQQLLAEFLDDQAHAARRTTLLNRKSAMRIASDRMWDDVVACLTRD